MQELVPAQLTLEVGVGAMAFDDGALWALAGDGRVIRRIDPDEAALHGQPVPVDVASDARLTLGGHAAWVTDAQGTSLLRLDY